MSYQPRNMLVTGGAGFIGANFIRYVLANESFIIINLDKLTYAGSHDNLLHLPHANRHHFIQGDIADQPLVEQIFAKYKIDTVVHFAAESHVDRSILDPSAFVTTNVTGTYTLLEAARKYWHTWDELNQCRFHHISTDEVFGSLDEHSPAFTEKHPYQPRSPYSATKAAADHLVYAYHHTYGLPITLSHCSNNYGPYQHEEKFIPTIIRACLDRQSIPVYGSGDNVRDWLYVADHCAGIMTILKQGIVGRCYNLGGNNEWNNLTLARYICESMDDLIQPTISHCSLLNFVTDRPGHDFRYAMDISRINKELHWVPRESFSSGIKKTIGFYREKFIG